MATAQSQLNLPPVLVQSLDRVDQSLDPSGQVVLTSLLTEAVDAARVSEKEAARDMGYDPAYWSRIKSGQKAAHLERVGRLPASVQREFVSRWGRMLGMHLTTEDARRRAVANLVKAAAEALAEIA